VNLAELDDSNELYGGLGELEWGTKSAELRFCLQ